MPRKKSWRRRVARPDAGWTDRSNMLEMSNEKLEKYYKAQHIVPDHEWDPLLNTLRQPLPSTFRVAAHRQMADAVNDVIKTVFLPKLQDSTFEGEPLPKPSVIPWYPKGYAWQVSMPRKSLRRSTVYKKFHKFLVHETEVGNISRQESASMIPPLFLDVKPQHWVMDMCAAPGSKTAQLVEFLHANDALDDSTMPTGLIVANDSDRKRAGILIHQSSRLPSPALMVTNLDASNYPALKIPEEFQSSVKPEHFGRRERPKDGLQSIRFDRILCDVPCSGDGTLRKNPGIWRNWQPMEGNGLHSLQLRILQRGMSLLKHDGTIVYSTCSLNPVENEAVVATALNSDPEFEIVDVSDQIPDLIRRPGLSSWQVTATREVDAMYASHAEYQEDLKKSEDQTKIRNKLLLSLWPPQNATELSLERCLRIYPHLQDTGGFFIAVLRRRSKSRTEQNVTSSRQEVPVQSEGKRSAEESPGRPDIKKARVDDETVAAADDVETANADNTAESLVGPKPSDSNVEGSKSSKKTKEKGSFKEDPFTLVSPEDKAVQSCLKQLDLKPDFPIGNLLVRNATGEPVRALYLVNDVVKNIIKSMDYSRIRLMSAGCKVFNRAEMGKGIAADDGIQPFRILSEGLMAMLPYIKRENMIQADIPALKILLESYNPLGTAFTGSFRDDIEAKPLGSYITCFAAGEVNGVRLTHELVLPLWKSGTSISLMIDKASKSALSLRLFGEDITTAGRLQQNQPGNDEEPDVADTDNSADVVDNAEEV